MWIHLENCLLGNVESFSFGMQHEETNRTPFNYPNGIVSYSHAPTLEPPPPTCSSPSPSLPTRSSPSPFSPAPHPPPSPPALTPPSPHPLLTIPLSTGPHLPPPRSSPSPSPPVLTFPPFLFFVFPCSPNPPRASSHLQCLFSFSLFLR